MRQIRTEIPIDAPAERVWRVLTGFAAYPEWNPFVRRARGEAKVGSRLEVEIHPPDQRTMTLRPRVLVADPGRELRWLGNLWVPGLFDGEHAFTIETLDEAHVRFIQDERFGGLLVPLLWTMIDRDVRRGFEEMNQALKQRAESDQ